MPQLLWRRQTWWAFKNFDIIFATETRRPAGSSKPATQRSTAAAAATGDSEKFKIHPGFLPWQSK
jgi:hypothetical protein